MNRRPRKSFRACPVCWHVPLATSRERCPCGGPLLPIAELVRNCRALDALAKLSREPRRVEP